ncbi:VanZ family protein [Paenibacillus guangzhouensis]|uniref:VanZ family protein n=1 Tax=Paenibacillus guangzhouensis TaxID=1473112 RepID=UPI00187B48A0|nr:VanZ family protein [Paenibacillus guangzhouensis]
MYKSKVVTTVVIIALFGYCVVIAALLFFRSRHTLDLYHYNMIPFATIEQLVMHRDHYNPETWVKNLFGNIILFMPLGVFIPLLNQRYLRVANLVIFVAVLIFVVECIQMLTYVGSFDVDDIMLNTLGAWLGLVITKKVCRQGTSSFDSSKGA